MTIHLYSDSFGQDGKSIEDDEFEDGWPTILGKIRNEVIYVNGEGGTGPNWSLQLLISDLEGRFREYRHAGGKIDLEYPKLQSQDTIIMLLSDQKRLEFPFCEDEDMKGGGDGIFVLAEEPVDERLDCWGNGRIDIFKKYGKYHAEIKMIANTLGPMFLYENVKNITFLHLLSKMFNKLNFLVFNCFSLNHYTSNLKNFNIKSTKLLYDLLSEDILESINSPNFYYCPTPISYMVGRYDGKKLLMNHMTPEQNKKFASFCNAILNNEEPDSSWFAWSEYDDPHFSHKKKEGIFTEPEPFPPIFIYE